MIDEEKYFLFVQILIVENKKIKMHFFHLTFHILAAIGILFYTTLLNILKLVIPYKYRSKSVTNELMLVTGAASGIGKLVAKRFAQLGARLVLVDVNRIANEQTAKEINENGGWAKAFTCDLCSREDIYRLADEVKQYYLCFFFFCSNS